MTTKVKLLTDCLGANPEFDRRQPVHRDHNWPDRVMPAGTEIEHPDAWYLCLPEPHTREVRAEPLDDHTRAKVETALAESRAILEARTRQQEADAAASATKRRRRKPVSR